MLTTTKSTTIQGSSRITTEIGEIMAVSMNATIPETGRATKSETILDKEVYDAHKDECRADMDEFTAYVRELEDAE